jgi:hypothetical protein
MGEVLDPRKKLTVSSLLLQAIVLLTFAAIYFYMYMTQGLFPSGFAFTPTAYFLVMGLLAIWLTSRHYSRSVLKRDLTIWAAIHICGSLFMLFTILNLFSVHASLPIAALLFPLLSLVLYIIPPVFVLVFANREQT